MKFDVVRAWKDETYRQTLRKEDLTALPPHPSGELELADDELEQVFGGRHTPGVGNADAFAHDDWPLSYALICEINIFSIHIEILTLDLINIGNPRTEVCVQ